LIKYITIKHALVTLHTSKLALANLLSKLDLRLLDLPAVLYKLILSDDWLPKVRYQTVGILFVMLDKQQRTAYCMSLISTL